MAKYLPGTPNTDYDFGQSFDYSLWVPGTVVELVNVKWNNDYRDVVRFDNSDALDSYIDSLAPAGITIDQVSYVKPNQPIRLNIPHNRVNKYNYLRASNPLQPINGDVQKNFYYFILDSNYIAPNTTELILQLDVWQTYVYSINFGRSYVERGHIGIANEKQFNHYGRDYLTVPEGLDIGSEYRHIKYGSRQIMNLSSYDILVVSTTDLSADPGTVSNPTLKSAHGSIFQGVPSGASMYVFNSVNGFLQYLREMTDAPWVTQGIISISLVPNVTRYHPDYVYTNDLPGGGSIAPSGGSGSIVHAMSVNWRNSKELKEALGTRYDHLKKFFTFPYLAIEMTCYSGNVTILKPESWNNDNAEVIERASLFPPGQRIVFMPVSYNSNENINATNEQWQSDFLNVATMFANFPNIPLVNDMAINFMAANNNMLAFARTSADWSQQRAMGMAQGQYDIAQGSQRTASDITSLANDAAFLTKGNQNRTNVTQAGLGAAGSIAGGIVSGGGFGGGAPGAVAGGLSGAINGGINAANAGINAAANDLQWAINSSERSQTTGLGNKQSQLIADTNKNLANWAARGDYANSIAGLNAKIQDAQLTQPSTSGSFGGETFNIINFTANMQVKWKMIDNANVRIIGEFWLRYGYAIRASIMLPQSLMVMTKFTYWKLTETYISSSSTPESFKQVIRGILEKGVTVWKNPADIGNIDWADNDPLPGISY